MHTSIFYLFIAIIILGYIVDTYFDYLNSKHRDKPIPKELDGIYDEEKYKQQQAYSKSNSKFSAISSAFSLVLILVFLFANGFAWLNGYLGNHIEHQLWLGLAFFGVLYVANDILSLPFSIYHTFVLEERFGFNKTTPKIFVLDKLKAYALMVIIGIPLYAGIYKAFDVAQDKFWLIAWLIIGGFMLFMSMFYSHLIVPLFNKQQALEAGPLKQKINDFAKAVDFKIKDIYEIDGSKRSTRANAYFTGLGATKRIVLYDTLLKDLDEEEIVAVLAHEIGHYKKKHTLTGLMLSMAQLGLMLFLLNIFIVNPALSQALGVAEPLFHIGIVAFSFLYSPVSTLTGILMNVFSRKNEYEADNFASSHYNASYLVSGLKKLAGNNLSNLTPHPAYVFVHYSHPDLYNRVRNLLKQKQ